MRISVRISSGPTADSKKPVKKSSAFTSRGPDGPAIDERHSQRECGGGQVGRRVGVHERAADRAAVADLPVADQAGDMRQQRNAVGEQRGVHDVGVTGGRADGDVAVVLADVGQLRDAGDVDEDGRVRQAQLHHRQQRMAAGEELGVVTVLGQ